MFHIRLFSAVERHGHTYPSTLTSCKQSMDTRNTAGLSLSSYIAAYNHRSDSSGAICVPLQSKASRTRAETGECSYFCWSGHSKESRVFILIHYLLVPSQLIPLGFFSPSGPYRQPEREKRSAAFQTKEPLTARTLSALPALSSHQHDECPRSSFNRLHAQGAGLFKSMSHFSFPVCFLHRNDLRAAFLLTSWFAKMKLSVKFG